MMWMAARQLHVTPTELLLTALTGYLPGGGSATGVLRIANWLGEAPPQDVAATSATTKAAVTTTNKDCEDDWGEGSYRRERDEGAAGAAGACLSDGDGEPDSAADDYGCDGSGELWRSGVRHGGERAGEGGVGRPGEDVADTVEVDGDLKFESDGGEAEGRAE